MPWRNLQTRASLRGFFAQTPMIQWTFRISEVVDQFLRKQFGFFSMNFLNFWFDATDKQIIINLSRYGSKSYVLVVLGDSVVTFLGESGDAAFCPSLYCILIFILSCRIRAVYHKISFSSIPLIVFRRGRQFFKQPKPHTMTGLHLTIEMFAINIRQL